VYDPGGIGSADIELPEDVNPQQMLLRFHLRGLEHWEFTYEQITVAGSLPSDPGADPQQTVRNAGQPSDAEQAITSDSPYWMPVKIVTPDGAPPTFPLTAGYIEVAAPEDYLAGSGEPFSLSWIDFYR
jgi:hypothetical protein